MARPHVILKLATSLDGRIATASGESRWITGKLARAQVQVMRAQVDAVMIGAGIRIVPVDMLLFENIINLIHTAAPSTKICFNVSPESTTEAVLRWVQP